MKIEGRGFEEGKEEGGKCDISLFGKENVFFPQENYFAALGKQFLPFTYQTKKTIFPNVFFSTKNVPKT